MEVTSLEYQVKIFLLQYIPTETKEALSNFGISYINTNKNEDVLQLFSVLESDYPDYFGGYYGSAIIYQEAKEIKKAINFFEKTIEKCTENQKWASEHSQKLITKLSE